MTQLNSEIMEERARRLREFGCTDAIIARDAEFIAALRVKAAKARRKVAVCIGSTIHFIEEEDYPCG